MKTKQGKLRTVLVSLCLAVGISLIASSCVNITWEKNDTFGLGVEVTAARANLVIYRGARSALYNVLQCCGPSAVRDVIWAAGKPPVVSACIKSLCVSDSVFMDLLHWYLFKGDDRLNDLAGAVKDAQKNYDCLAFTFISYGVISNNWTHKSASCQIGRTF